ncbi:MAG: hypothetical protein ABTQ73_00805 [Caldilineales bacterium]
MVSFAKAQLDQSGLAQEIGKALRATVFSSGMNIAPRRVQVIADQMTERFFAFRNDGNEQAALDYGQTLADEGLGVPSVLVMTEQIRQAAYAAAGSEAALLKAAAGFCNRVIEGFIRQHESGLLQQQERAHRAYLAALDSGSVFPRRAEPLA